MSTLPLAEFTVSLGKSRLPGHRVVQVTDRWSWLGDPTDFECWHRSGPSLAG